MAVIREWSLVPPADATECDWDARGVVAVDPPSNESRRLCSIAAAAAAAAAAICCSGVSGVGIAAIAAFARAVRASGLSGESPAAAPSRLLRLVRALLLPELKNVGDPPLVGELVASLLPAYEAIVLVHPSIHDTAVSSPVPSFPVNQRPPRGSRGQVVHDRHGTTRRRGVHRHRQPRGSSMVRDRGQPRRQLAVHKTSRHHTNRPNIINKKKLT